MGSVKLIKIFTWTFWDGSKMLKWTHCLKYLRTNIIVIFTLIYTSVMFPNTRFRFFSKSLASFTLMSRWINVKKNGVRFNVFPVNNFLFIFYITIYLPGSFTLRWFIDRYFSRPPINYRKSIRLPWFVQRYDYDRYTISLDFILMNSLIRLSYRQLDHHSPQVAGYRFSPGKKKIYFSFFFQPTMNSFNISSVSMIHSVHEFILFRYYIVNAVNSFDRFFLSIGYHITAIFIACVYFCEP